MASRLSHSDRFSALVSDDGFSARSQLLRAISANDINLHHECRVELAMVVSSEREDSSDSCVHPASQFGMNSGREVVDVLAVVQGAEDRVGQCLIAISNEGESL